MSEQHKNDGGSAFPMGYHRDGNSADHQGMTTQDQFEERAQDIGRAIRKHLFIHQPIRAGGPLVEPCLSFEAGTIIEHALRDQDRASRNAALEEAELIALRIRDSRARGGYGFTASDEIAAAIRALKVTT